MQPYTIALLLTLTSLAKAHFYPEEIFASEDNYANGLDTDMRLCWSCGYNVEYLCKNYVFQGGQFKCKFGEKWSRLRRKCTAHECPTNAQMARDDPLASSSGGFDQLPVNEENSRRTMSDYDVSRQRANKRLMNEPMNNVNVGIGTFAGVQRGKYKGMNKGRLSPTKSGPVDCSGINHQTNEEVCSGGFILNNRCYQLTVDKLKQSDAKKRCESKSTNSVSGYTGLAVIKDKETYNHVMCYLIPFINALDIKNKMAFNTWLGASYWQRIEWEDGDINKDTTPHWAIGEPRDISTWTRLGLHIQNEQGKHGIINRNGKLMSYQSLCEFPVEV